MKYKNPIIKGMYPDPSVCCVNGIYYMVNSSFEYFPGVPIFSSINLINWTQIGNCLSRVSQLDLGNSLCSEGIFAPTIRWNNGKFYVITTYTSRKGLLNFLVTAEDPAGEWSDPIYLELDGIDPSLYWEEENTYVQYAGRGEIFQIQIDENSGEILKGPISLTFGCGGRDAEGPHLWKRNGYYYLMLAEGGTREGHFETMMRGENIWGPFIPSPYNPVISNKDLGREPIQCVGHADWIVGPDHKDYLVTLGTRHVRHKTILGRETMLTPAYWTEDGWLKSQYGYMPMEWEGNLGTEQNKDNNFELDRNRILMPFRIISPRTDNRSYYQFKDNQLIIRANDYILDDGKASFWGIRQGEIEFSLEIKLKCDPKDEKDEIGLAMISADKYYMSLFCTIRNNEKAIVLKKKMEDIETETIYHLKTELCNENFVCLKICGRSNQYDFYYIDQFIGSSYQKHLSAESAETPNTGVVGGFYIVGNGKAIVESFTYIEG